MRRCLPFFVLTVLLPFTLHATEADLTQPPAALAPVIAKLHPQHGEIAIGAGLATLNVPENIGYLIPGEADLFLRGVAGYSGKIKNLGAFVPSIVSIGSKASWFSLITYQEDGHVEDGSAEEMTSANLMRQLQDQNTVRNAALKQEGYGMLSADIAGWADAPHYDTTTHSLTWAVEFIHHDTPVHNVIYNIRVFGRKGMLVMSIPCRLEQLPLVESDADKIASLTRFNAPNRYDDFNPAADKTAHYSMHDVILGDLHTRNSVADNKTEFTAFQREEILLLIALMAAAAFMLKRFRKRPSA